MLEICWDVWSVDPDCLFGRGLSLFVHNKIQAGRAADRTEPRVRMEVLDLLTVATFELSHV